MLCTEFADQCSSSLTFRFSESPLASAVHAVPFAAATAAAALFFFFAFFALAAASRARRACMRGRTCQQEICTQPALLPNLQICGKAKFLVGSRQH